VGEAGGQPRSDDAPGRGLFLVLEGIEGSGKSTQARMLGEWLAAHGVPHRLTREPGGTALGEQIRRMLLDSEAVPPRSELLLMLAARAALLEQEVAPALERGEVVVADRYELSSLAYQGAGRELGIDAVRRLNAWATSGLRPALTVILDVPEAAGVARRVRRTEEDRIERAGRDFHGRVAAAYRLLGSEPGVAVLDGTPPAPEVHRRLLALLEERFPETFAAAAG
jgi:dTMP kinase